MLRRTFLGALAASASLPAQIKPRIAPEAAEAAIVSKHDPVYPLDALHKGIEATVKVEIDIGLDGVPTRLKAVSGPEEFGESAMRAVSRYRYRPFVIDGKPAEVTTTVEVVFKLPPTRK